MPRRGLASRLTTGLVAATLFAGSAASAAPRTVDPLVALSVFGTAQSRAAVCAAGSAAAAAVATQAAPAAPGCVLPVVDAAPPVVDTAPPPMAPAIVESGGGIGILPLLLGLGALAAAALLLLDDDDDADIDIPVSPE